MKLEIKSVSEILEAGRMADEEFNRHNRIEDGYLVLDVNAHHTYDIELSRINTHRDLLDWMRQLGEKVWMDKDRLLRVIALLAVHRGLKY